MALDIEKRSALSGKVAAATNNIPTTFGTGAGSQILTSIANAQNIAICNETGGRIAVNYSSSDPSNAPTAVDAYCPATSNLVMNNIKVSSVIYIKSDTGAAITADTVECFVW